MDVAHSVDHCLQSIAKMNVNVILLHYNVTGKLSLRKPRTDGGMDIMKMLFIAISCLIVLENLVVLLAIIKNMRFRRWVSYCIANITLSDLLAGIAYLFNLCMSGNMTFRLSPSIWFFREGVLFVALAASIFSLLITAVERYTTMVKPVAEKELSKTIRVYGLIGLCWMLAIVIGMLPLMGWNCVCDFTNCSSLLPLYSKKYILVCIVIFSIILFGIILLYGSIYHLVKGSAQRVCVNNQKKSLKLLKTVLMILGAFIICWSPLFVLLLLDVFCHNRTCEHLRNMDWALALAVLNSAINPLIYSCGSIDVRRAILKLICCCCIRAGVRGPSDCLVFKDITSGSSESFRRQRDSVRLSRALSIKSREPLTSNSSVGSI
ncbi:sphingosine 1-phosphate receptor 4 [Ambystoma mexicanum]|uniref:sphingosine 1-phosphate receptor 4 n=1 Tax=Ambystoma mexicanum TaxID=8296 RepID=UPI0037E85D3B